MSDAEVLARRARKLATARLADTTAAEAADSSRYLLATCGKERFAVALTSVAEVYRPAGVTPLPRTTPPLYGLAAWRGRILSISLIADTQPRPGAGLIAVLAVGEAVFGGVWVEQVEGEITFAESEIHDTEDLRGGREAYLSGVTGDAVLVLDAIKLKAVLERERPVGVASDERNSTRGTG
ncbi:MAG: chemotaxis protein CheW [Gemmatimonadaceae bacterium]